MRSVMLQKIQSQRWRRVSPHPPNNNTQTRQSLSVQKTGPTTLVTPRPKIRWNIEIFRYTSKSIVQPIYNYKRNTIVSFRLKKALINYKNCLLPCKPGKFAIYKRNIIRSFRLRNLWTITRTVCCHVNLAICVNQLETPWWYFRTFIRSCRNSFLIDMIIMKK